MNEIFSKEKNNGEILRQCTVGSGFYIFPYVFHRGRIHEILRFAQNDKKGGRMTEIERTGEQEKLGKNGKTGIQLSCFMA